MAETTNLTLVATADRYETLSVKYFLKQTKLDVKLGNKRELAQHIFRQLNWKPLGKDSDSITFEAKVDGDVATALKALHRIKGLKKADLKGLMKLPMGELSRQLAVRTLVEG